MKERLRKFISQRPDGSLRFDNIQCRMSDKALYEYLQSKYRSVKEHAYIILNDLKDTPKCPECDKKLNFEQTKFCYKIACRGKCYTNHKKKTDPDYFKMISCKSQKTKQETIIDGKTVAQLGAERAAKNRQHKQSQITQKIRDIKRLSREKQEFRNRERVIRLIDRLGIIRFSRLFIRINYRKFAKEVVSDKLLYVLGDDSYQDLKGAYRYGIDQFIYEELKQMGNFICRCVNCGSEYTKTVDVLDIPRFNSHEFCGRSCLLEVAHTNGDRKCDYSYTEAHRKSISESSTRMHQRFTPEEKKVFAEKRIMTMENDKDSDGNSMIVRKTKKALKTKLERGLINNINEDKTEYDEYRRDVHRFTNRNDLTLLENHEKRGKHTYHLDHIFPISKGYMHNIPAELIADIRNLRFILALDNRKKTDIIEEIPSHIQEYIASENIKIIL